VNASYDALVDLLDSIECFIKRLNIYTHIPPTHAMDEIILKIMVELLSTLALATKELKQGRSIEFHSQCLLCSYLNPGNTANFVKKRFGQNTLDAVLQRLDRLTQDEARTTAAQTLEVIYNLTQSMAVVLDGEQSYWACYLPSAERPSL
jgi:hypothetical protein